MKWNLRFRFGYLTKYFPYQKFSFGFVILGLLIYKKKDLIYYKYKIDADLLRTAYFPEMIIQDTQEQSIKNLYKSIPYDFGFLILTTYSDYDIDYNRYHYTVEGFAVPGKGRKVMNKPPEKKSNLFTEEPILAGAICGLFLWGLVTFIAYLPW